MKKLCCGAFVVCMLLLTAVGCSKREVPADAEQSPPIALMSTVPDCVLGFAATSGGDNLKQAFEASALGRLWHDPELQTFYQAVSAELLEKLRQNVPAAGKGGIVDTILDFLRLAAKRPLIIGAAKKPNCLVPVVYGFAILDAGPEKAEISAAIDAVEALLPKNDIAHIFVGSLKMHGLKVEADTVAYWGWVGDHFVLAVNDDDGLAVKHIRNPRAEADGHLRHGPAANDILSIFVDCEGIARVVRDMALVEGSTDELAPVKAVLEALGFSEITTITSKKGFRGPDLVSTKFIGTEKQRKGLLACLKPIDKKMFDHVDSHAGRVIAFNLDFCGIYDAIMKAIEVSMPGHEYTEMQRAIEQAESEMEFEIRDGLLKSLAGPMVLYSLPAGEIREAPGGGAVAIIKLADAKLIEKALIAAGQIAAEMSNGVVQVNSRPQDDGTTVNTWVVAPLAMMQLMPCWTIADDRLVIASSPSLQELGRNRKQSIRSAEGYKKATARLPKKPVYFSYTDARSQFRQMIFMYCQYWPMVRMFAAQAQLDLPLIFPTLADFEKTLDYSHQYAWFDSTGLRSYARGPGVEISLESIAGTSLSMGIIMPALARVRQIAYRLHAGTNLAAVGKAFLAFHNGYNKLPTTLEELVDKVNLPPEKLDSKRKPKDFDGPSFIYVRGNSVSSPPTNILVYENPAFLFEGTNVLYLDGHAAFVRREQFLSEIKATYEELGREMPEVKFRDEIEPPEESQPTGFPF